MIIEAILSLMLLLTFIALGFYMIYKYTKYKKNDLLYLGLYWIGLSQTWLASTITVFMVLVDPNSPGLSPEGYFIFYLAIVAAVNPFYVVAMTDLVFQDYKKILRSVALGYSIFYEIFGYMLVFTNNVDLMVTKLSPTVIMPSPMNAVLLAFFLIFFIVLGFTFCFKGLKSDSKEVKLKARILLLAFILFIFGNVLAQTELIVWHRIILIVCGVLFAFGFALPSYLKRLLLKENT